MIMTPITASNYNKKDEKGGEKGDSRMKMRIKGKVE